MALPTWQNGSYLGSFSSGDAATISVISYNADSIEVLNSNIPGDTNVFDNLVEITLFGKSYSERANFNITLRARNSEGITDKSFSIAIQPALGITWSQTSSLGNWELGKQKEVLLTATWLNPLEYILLEGELPRGVYLDSNGILFGIPGSDLKAYDLDSKTWRIDQPANLRDTGVYNFIIRVRDRINKEIGVDKAFTITTIQPTSNPDAVFLMDVNTIGALSRLLYASSTVDLASSEQLRTAFSFFPPWLDPDTNLLGMYRHNTNIIEPIKIWDPMGQVVEYEFVSGAPAFLAIDKYSGYISGKLPDISFVKQRYEITIRITRLINGSTVTQDQTFVLIINGLNGFTVDFVDNNGQPYNLGSVAELNIQRGEVSSLSVRARWEQNPDQLLFYNLIGGLPSGLELTPRGFIVGSVDWDAAIGSYDFSINAYDPSLRTEDLSPLNLQTQLFRINVLPSRMGNTVIEECYDAYYRAFTTLDQRSIWQNLVTDSVVFNENILYRSEDENFGRRLDLEFLAFPCLRQHEAEEFAEAMNENWQSKRFKIGNFHFAKMNDVRGNYVCDVIYVDLKDNLTNSKNQSPPLSIYKYYSDTTLFPSTLENQLKRLQTSVGQESDSMLPSWMTTPQDDGRPLGLIPAAVLCYVLPGNGIKALKKIKNIGYKLNQIDFQVDRIVLKKVPTNSLDTLIDSGTTLFDGGQTTLDKVNRGNKYIYFNTDGAVYDIIN